MSAVNWFASAASDADEGVDGVAVGDIVVSEAGLAVAEQMGIQRASQHKIVSARNTKMV